MKLYKETPKKEEQIAMNRDLLTIAIVVGIALLGVVAFGIFRDFDAQGYVRATLKQTLTGDVKAAVEMTEGTTEEELLAQYEAGIQSFVTNNLTGGAEMSEEMQAQYTALCKEIFAASQFEVKEAEKVNSKEYKVPVEYSATNVFALFSEAVKAEAERLLEKVDNGEYKGTAEEINAQMQKEIIENAYQILATAQEEAEYAEKETMVFTVKEGDNGLFAMDEAQVYQFITKIMGLDEIQD